MSENINHINFSINIESKNKLLEKIEIIGRDNEDDVSKMINLLIFIQLYLKERSSYVGMNTEIKSFIDVIYTDIEFSEEQRKTVTDMIKKYTESEDSNNLKVGEFIFKLNIEIEGMKKTK